MHLRLYPLTLRFRAIGPVRFPAGRAGNVFRGAFGLALRKTSCSCPGGEHHMSCLYRRWFEPGMFEPSMFELGGMADCPRPFVLRAHALDGQTFEPGQDFTVLLHWFDLAETRFDLLSATFADLASTGFGPGRARAELLGLEHDAELLALPLTLTDEETIAAERHNSQINAQLDFLTPTEIKWKGRIAARPEFPVLMSALLRRIKALRSLYDSSCAQEPDTITSLGKGMHGIALSSCTLKTVEQDRRSSRTAQVHSLGGFIGQAHYSGGALPRFQPLLQAGQWTGVGSHTSWGNGAYRLLNGPGSTSR